VGRGDLVDKPIQPRRAAPITLKARFVFPVASDLIHDGEVAIAGGRIRAVGRRLDLGPTLDLGNVAILPGFVNAHTHLEFSYLRQPLGGQALGFVDWIRLVMASRSNRPEPVERSIGRGIEEAVKSGATTLGEIARPEAPPLPPQPVGCGLTVFLELIAPTVDRASEAMAAARRHLALADRAEGWRVGLAPHAPYSVHPELLAAVVKQLTGLGSGIPLAFHLAESREEMEFLESGTGPFRELLSAIPGWKEGMIARGTRPADYVRLLSPAERTLLIHGNYFADEEIALVAEARGRMSVVYCPRTHAHFAHPDYPLGKLLAAGVRVALGTDSRASSPDLNMLAEIRFAAQRHPNVPRPDILRMATLHGAEALGIAAATGSITPGKHADLAILRLPDRDVPDPHDLLFDAEEPVVGTWVRGVPVAADRLASAGGAWREIA